MSKPAVVARKMTVWKNIRDLDKLAREIAEREGIPLMTAYQVAVDEMDEANGSPNI